MIAAEPWKRSLRCRPPFDSICQTSDQAGPFRRADVAVVLPERYDLRNLSVARPKWRDQSCLCTMPGELNPGKPGEAVFFDKRSIRLASHSTS